jgi:hypothetical protein
MRLRFSVVRLQQVGLTACSWTARATNRRLRRKVSATFADGFRGGEMWTVYGRDADRKARKIADIAWLSIGAHYETRAGGFQRNVGGGIGAETHYGAARRA